MAWSVCSQTVDRCPAWIAGGQAAGLPCWLPARPCCLKLPSGTTHLLLLPGWASFDFRCVCARGEGELLVYQNVICLHTSLGSSCFCHFQVKLFSMKSLLPPHSQFLPLVLESVMFYPLLLVVCVFCCVRSNLKAEMCLVHTSLL